jgi:hypothetical protein
MSVFPQLDAHWSCGAGAGPAEAGSSRSAWRHVSIAPQSAASRASFQTATAKSFVADA